MPERPALQGMTTHELFSELRDCLVTDHQRQILREILRRHDQVLDEGIAAMRQVLRERV